MSCPEGTFFHSIYFYHALKCEKSYQPFALFVLDKNEVTAMLLGYVHIVKKGILSKISARIVIPQLPLYTSEASLRILLYEFKKRYGKRVIYSEFRCQKPDEVFHKTAFKAGLKHKAHLNILVDCKDEQKTTKQMSESKRRQIRKALKNGAYIEENPSQEQVSEFYDILSDLYQSKVKKPLAHKDYFYSLYQLKDGQAFYVKFFLIIVEDKVVGGIVSPVSNQSAIHEHYIAGLDQEYKNHYPSVVATWAAIDYATKNEIDYFDFMGAGKPDEDYGVRDFKLKFGGELIESGRYEYYASKMWYNIASKGFRLYQRVKRK